MADDHVTTPPAALPTTATSLTPCDYLRAVQMLEGGMPPDTRAYLVYVNEGIRHMTPVSRSASVIDLRGDLLSHLRSSPLPKELLEELHEFCVEHLNLRMVPQDLASNTDDKLMTMLALVQVAKHDLERGARDGDDGSVFSFDTRVGTVLRQVERCAREAMDDLADWV